ncbi:MAG TPA: CHC2 zinc finger domain-containing protein [Chitinophagales bacterium]|nr:CHC2 zinc finger domain-containing protein [Chitinophagales bacterium]
MDIKALKSQLEITHIAEQLGIRVGKNDKSLCPFHDDKSPSLQFSRDKQIATCFSSNCNAGTMDVVELVKRKENWDLPQTLKWLEEQAGIYPSKQAEVKSEIKKEVSAQVATEITESERIEILSQLFQLFERSFIASSTAKSYAESRNIDPSSISIGYNTGNFHQSIYLKEDRETMLKKYIALGLLSTGHIGYKAFGKGCLVFPLKNENGQIVSLYFRETDPNKSTKHYYLKNRQGLYPGYPKKDTQTLILTESIIDTITLHQNYSSCHSLT